MSCRAQAAGQQEPALAWAIPISSSSAALYQPFSHSSPRAHTTTQWAGSGSLPQNHHPRKTCTLAEPGLPGPQLLTLATPVKARIPAGRSSHVGDSISHPLHASPWSSSKPKSGHRSRGDQCQCSYSWLGNQIGSFSAKCKFYLNWMPIRVRGNKSTKSLLHLGLVFLSTSYRQAYFNLPSLSYPVLEEWTWKGVIQMGAWKTNERWAFNFILHSVVGSQYKMSTKCKIQYRN